MQIPARRLLKERRKRALLGMQRAQVGGDALRLHLRLHRKAHLDHPAAGQHQRNLRRLPLTWRAGPPEHPRPYDKRRRRLRSPRPCMKAGKTPGAALLATAPVFPAQAPQKEGPCRRFNRPSRMTESASGNSLFRIAFPHIFC